MNRMRTIDSLRTRATLSRTMARWVNSPELRAMHMRDYYRLARWWRRAKIAEER